MEDRERERGEDSRKEPFNWPKRAENFSDQSLEEDATQVVVGKGKIIPLAFTFRTFVLHATI